MYELIDKSLNNRHFLHTYTLAEANDEILESCKKWGRLVKIKTKDGFVRTRELYNFNVIVEYPQNKEIPNKCRWKSYYALEEYSKEIMTDRIPDGFTYTYGSLMRKPFDQVEKVIEILKSDRNNRQAVIMLGDGNCLNDNEPPCCRIVDFKVREEKLNIGLYFRSHDITAWFANMWAFSKLQKYIADEIEVQTGKLDVKSESLHLYEGDCDLLNWTSFSNI